MDLKNLKYKWNISYYLGTGIGLEQEEIPTLEPSNFNKFKENMIVIFIHKHIQIRFPAYNQDTICITESNYILLTNYSRNEDKL